MSADIPAPRTAALPRAVFVPANGRRPGETPRSVRCDRLATVRPVREHHADAGWPRGPRASPALHAGRGGTGAGAGASRGPALGGAPLPPDVGYADYMVPYVERDVRQMVNVRDLATFRRFVRMCATRTGQVVNLSSLAADCGITHNTAKAWLSVLEASYPVHLLPPYHRNFGKRLIKAPKLY